MRIKLTGTVLIICCVAAAPALAAGGRMLKREPAMGKMRPGERVLVDDGSCGPGKVKEVIGGNHWKVGGSPGSNIERTRRCIPR
jgi:hypothetical protein